MLALYLQYDYQHNFLFTCSLRCIVSLKKSRAEQRKKYKIWIILYCQHNICCPQFPFSFEKLWNWKNYFSQMSWAEIWALLHHSTTEQRYEIKIRSAPFERLRETWSSLTKQVLAGVIFFLFITTIIYWN